MIGVAAYTGHTTLHAKLPILHRELFDPVRYFTHQSRDMYTVAFAFIMLNAVMTLTMVKS